MRYSTERVLPPFLVLAVLTCLLACHKEAPPPVEHRFQVQMVFSAADHPMWDRYATETDGLLQKSFGAEVSTILAGSSNDRRSVLKAAGGRKVDLVTCFGPGFVRPVLSVGPRYPATAFLLDQGDILAPNVARMEFLHQGAAYLAGVTAGILGGSITGIIEGDPGIVTSEIEAGFEQGFMRRQPWGQVEHVEEGPGAVEELADQGVKIAMYAAAQVDPEVLAAAYESGLMLITIGGDSLQPNPDVVVAAIVVDVAEAIKRVAADVVDDTFIGRVYAFDLGSGVVDLRLQPGIPENKALTEALDQARAAVNAGMVEIESFGL